MKQIHDYFYYKDAYMLHINLSNKDSYATKRNKRIAIRRALYTLGVLIAVWGLVWMMNQ